MTDDTQPTRTSDLSAIHRGLDEGPATWAMGGLFEHLLTVEQSAGALELSLTTMPSGAATPLHRHTREAEAFYVLDGSLTYRAGEELFHLEAGHSIYLPQGLPHAFRVTGTQPARFLGLTAPGGLMHLYDEVGIPATERRVPGPDGPPLEDQIIKWLTLSPQYGIEIVGPPIDVHA